MKPFRHGDFLVKLMSCDEEKDAVFDLARRVNESWISGMRPLYFGNPGFRRRFCLLVKKGDDLVGHAMCFFHHCWMGGRPVPTGRIHWVAVEPAFQKAGLGKLMMRTWLSILRDENVPMSWLWGIRGYYERFHYYYACPWAHPAGGHLASLPTAKVPAASGAFSIGRMRSSEIDRARVLFNAVSRQTNLEVIYSKEVSRWILGKGYRSGGELLSVRKHGVFDGFFGLHRTSDAVAASIPCTRGPDADRAILAHLGKTARRHRIPDIALYCPLDRPIVGLLWEAGGSLRCPRSLDVVGATMVRILDPMTVLRAMSSRLLPRMRSLDRDTGKRGIAVVSEIGTACPRLRGDEVEVLPTPSPGALRARLSARVFTQIVTGYAGYRDLADRGDVPSRGPAAETLSALFPREYPFLSLSV